MNDSPIGEKKDALRRKLRRLRAGLSPQERISSALALRDRVALLPEFREASLIGAYYPCHSEADPRPIVELALSRGKRVFLPLTRGAEMFWREISSLDDGAFVTGQYGIREPGEGCPSWEPEKEREPVFWLVPGVGFDRSCRRLGQGGGYYDRMIENLRRGGLGRHHFVGLALEIQLTDSIPADGRDQGLDAVATPGTLITAQ